MHYLQYFKCPKITVSIICFLITSTLGIYAQDDVKIRYFDENYTEISKKQFRKKIDDLNHYEIFGDSVHHRKLISRYQRGNVSNRNKLLQRLEKYTGFYQDSIYPLVIIYHPGIDECNAHPNVEFMVNKYVTLQQYINSIGSFTPIYLCRYLEDVKEYNGKVLWHEDPSDIVKRMFFQYHYPCESFVVIAPSGAYISFLGEYPIEYVIDAIEALASTSINDEK